MNQQVVATLAQALTGGGLIHPGDDNTPATAIPLPGFKTTGMSDEQAADMVGQAGTLVAEAIVALIETTHDIVPKTELAALRTAAADAPEGTRTITVHCSYCDTTHSAPLLELTVGKTDQVDVPGPLALAALATRAVQCPHQAIETAS